MRLLAAFVWLHWKQQWNALANRRRSAASRFAAGSVVAVRVILGLLFAVLATAGAAAGWVGGEALLAAPDRRAPALAVLRILAGFVSVLALLLPILRAGFGGLPGTERFLLLPISRRGLHALETAGFLADPWLLLFLPALAAVAIPTLVSRPLAGVSMLLAALAFLGVLGLLAAALTFAVRIVLRDRRRAEAAALVLFLALITLSLLPALLDESQRRKEDAEAPARVESPTTEAARPGEGFEGSDRFPWALQLLPSEAYSRVAAEASAGAPLRGSLSFLPLAALAGACWFLSGAVWRRLVGSPETGSRRRVSRALPRWRRLPGVSPPTLAVAEAVVRGTLRTVQGKIVAIMPTLMVTIFSVLGEAESGPWGRMFGGPGVVLAAAFLGITGLQNVLLNLFGVDGGGLTLQLLLPLDDRRIVRGKALGGAILLALILTPALVVALLLGHGISPILGVAGFLTSLGTYLLFFPAAATLSLLFPKASNLAKMGQEGKPHPAAALIGFVGLLIVLLPGGAIGFLALALAGPWGALAAEALFTLIAGLLFLLFSRSAAAVLRLRRDVVYLAVRGS